MIDRALAGAAGRPVVIAARPAVIACRERIRAIGVGRPGDGGHAVLFVARAGHGEQAPDHDFAEEERSV